MYRFFLVFVTLFCADVAVAQEAQLQFDCTEQSIEQQGQVAAADYKPGVDVYGNEVVSAEVDGTLETLNYPVEIPVDFDLLYALNLSTSSTERGNIDLKSEVSHFTIYEDGRVEYNGQDISSKVSVECIQKRDMQERERLENVLLQGDDEENVVKSDGQEVQSSVSSEPENLLEQENEILSEDLLKEDFKE